MAAEIRERVGQKESEILTGQVSSEDMVELTYAVDVDGRPVDQTAHEFLVAKGLLSA